MIPNNIEINVGQNIEIINPSEQPSKTYQLDFQVGRVRGFIDGREAIIQAIYKILMTERFEHLIYSWNYGFESTNIIGQTFDVIESELKRNVQEALLADDRITAVHSFVVSRSEKRAVLLQFTVDTIFGAVPVSREVGISV